MKSNWSRTYLNPGLKLIGSLLTQKLRHIPCNIIELLHSDGTTTNSDTEIATILNDYFSSVYLQRYHLLPCSGSNWQSSDSYLIQSGLPQREVVYSKIMNLHSSKNPGPDGWPVPIIKPVSDFITIPLSIIFKKSFNSGILLHDWKNAHQVTPIHNKCTRNQVCNYR